MSIFTHSLLKIILSFLHSFLPFWLKMCWNLLQHQIIIFLLFYFKFYHYFIKNCLFLCLPTLESFLFHRLFELKFYFISSILDFHFLIIKLLYTRNLFIKMLQIFHYHFEPFFHPFHWIFTSFNHTMLKHYRFWMNSIENELIYSFLYRQNLNIFHLTLNFAWLSFLSAKTKKSIKSNNKYKSYITFEFSISNSSLCFLYFSTTFKII